MKKTLLTFFLALILTAPVKDAQSTETVNFGNYYDLALKVIAKSDIPKNPKSDRKEFLGIKELKQILGEEKQDYYTTFTYISNKKVEKESSTTSWYYFLSPAGKKIYALYYQKNKVTQLMQEGDLLSIGKKDNKLDIIVLKQNSESAHQLLGALGLENKPGPPQAQSPDETSETDKTPPTGKLLIIGPVTKYYDGNTFVIGGQMNIKMRGSDAPEINQVCKTAKDKYSECGKKSVDYLKKLVGSKQISCIHNGWDVHTNHTFACTNSKGTEINRQLVAEGMAVSEPPQTYQAEEQQAQSQKKGLHQSYFARPAEWRQTHKLSP